MVEYVVSYTGRKGIMDINLSNKEIYLVERRDPDFHKKILRIYQSKFRYVRKLNWHYLNFDKKPDPDSRDTSHPKDDDHLLGACDKDWCNYCRKGDYDKCPNR